MEIADIYIILLLNEMIMMNLFNQLALTAVTIALFTVIMYGIAKILWNKELNTNTNNDKTKENN